MSHFPKAHMVTFKYYVGVIHFLDEEYHKVRLSCLPISPRLPPFYCTYHLLEAHHLTHRPKKT